MMAMQYAKIALLDSDLLVQHKTDQCEITSQKLPIESAWCFLHLWPRLLADEPCTSPMQSFGPELQIQGLKALRPLYMASGTQHSGPRTPYSTGPHTAHTPAYISLPASPPSPDSIPKDSQRSGRMQGKARGVLSGSPWDSPGAFLVPSGLLGPLCPLCVPWVPHGASAVPSGPLGPLGSPGSHWSSWPFLLLETPSGTLRLFPKFCKDYNFEPKH
jgi:hypothetical protein